MVHLIPGRWPFAVWLILFPVLLALIAAGRVDHPAGTWHTSADLGTAAALSEPALLADPPAVVWQTGAALVYQRLDGSHERQEILPYPDVHPVRWQVAPVDPDRYHIVWLEDNNRLRSALISTDGETLRGPILLADGIRPDFITLPVDQGMIVVWLNDHADEIHALTIDSAGRPGPITNASASRVVRVAAAIDGANRLHLTWLTAPTPGTLAVHYQAFDAAAFNLQSSIMLQNFSLAAGETIAEFAFGLDTAYGYVVWSTSSAHQPDVERLQMLPFTLDTPPGAQLNSLLLTGYTWRWPRPAPGQHTMLTLAVSVRTPDGWRPAVGSFQQASMTDFDFAASLPADSGPPALVADPSGGLILAWTGLESVNPHLYMSRTTGASWDTATDSPDHWLIRTLAGAGVGFALMWVWLLMPGCLLWLAPDRAPKLPLVLALYTAGKLIWPASWFARLPPWIEAIGLNRYGLSAWIIGMTVLLIGLAAGVVWIRARRRDPRRRLIAYLLTDAVLTCFVFGANLLG